MSTLITSIETLKKVVKVNASLPWESVEPYVNEAEQQLGEYFPEAFVAKLSAGDPWFDFARQAVGPMALSLAIDEMAVNVGDAGITVINEREGKRAAASDSKISAAKASLQQRASANLSRLISYVMLKGTYDVSDCPLFAELASLLCFSMHSVMKRINIQHDYITLFALMPTMHNVQRQLAKTVGDELMGELLDRSQSLGADKLKLRSLCKDYIVFRTAYLHTSSQTRRQRTAADRRIEWQPTVRPLFEDVTDEGNYYDEEARTAMADIVKEVARLTGTEGDDADDTPDPKRRRHTATF